MLGREFCRGLIVQCAVRPMLVVVSAPNGDQDTCVLQGRKPVVIQALVPDAPVEALDERILRGFTCLDQLELNTVLCWQAHWSSALLVNSGPWSVRIALG